MPSVALTRATVLLPVCEATRHVNVPVEKLCRKRHLPTWEIDNPNIWVPTNAAIMLAQDVHGIVGPEVFGLWMERASDLSALGPFGDTLRRSRTLFDALQRYHRFYRQFRNYAKLSMVRSRSHLWLRRFVDPRMPGNKEMLQLYALTEVTKIVRLAAGDSWQPKKIVLQADAGSMLKTMPHLAGADALLDADYCAIAIPVELLSLPIKMSCSDDVMQGADDAPAWLPPPERFSDSLLAIVSNLFHDGYPGIDSVAESIGVSRRTLQRGLGAEGMTYRDLIDGYRFETAKRLVSEDGANFSDVAATLEYNDASSFSRAFRRWAGVTPREYHALHTMH
jgi:AraC-like DNA-binding protein